MKKEFDQYSPTLPSNSDPTSNRKSRGRPRKNLEELAASSIKKEKVPYLQKIRGLMKKVGDRYWYTSHKLMLEYQVKYRDTFYINIPPSDFTEEDSATAAELLFSVAASLGLFSLVLSSVLVLVVTGSMGSKACNVSPSRSLLGLFN